MTRYIIHKHCVATESNHNFKGEIHDYYNGKAEHDVGTSLSHDTTDSLCISLVKEYGYTNKATANRGLKKAIELAEWETSNGWWKVDCEIIAVEV